MTKPVLMIGGYGVTGRQTATLLRRFNPELPIAVAGRSLDRAEALASELGSAFGVRVDLDTPSLGLADADFSAVVVLVKDATLNSMAFAAEQRAPYLSLSSGAFEAGPEMAHGLQAARITPVLLASHWMAGAVTLAALWLAQRFAEIASLRAAVLIDRDDIAGGPATQADFERINRNCSGRLFRTEGRYEWATGAAAVRPYRGVDGASASGALAVGYDLLSLGSATRAREIEVVEEFGVSASRRSGGRPADEISLELAGRGRDDKPLHVRQGLVSVRDQVPLTALTVAIYIERLLGLADGPPPPPGLYFPEHVVDPGAFVARLRHEGVVFTDG